MKEDPNINKPIFVIGTGRCGLTPLMDLIAYHKEFAWPSQYNKMFPSNYRVSFFSRIVDLPLVNSRIKYLRYIPAHTEAFAFWNNFFYGFRRPFRDLVEDDVTPGIKSKFRAVIGSIMKYQGKTRFIAEYSGWSRIRFMKSICPDAQFIHIVRDGRAVSNSLLNVGYWKGWEGVHNWRWGIPNKYLLKKLEKYDYSFLALAAVQWKILINNIVEQSKFLPKENILVIRYKDMVKDPHKEAYRCIEFCGLDKDCKKFKKHLSTVKIVDANKKKFRIPAWRENMSQRQINMLNDLLRKELVNFNYL